MNNHRIRRVLVIDDNPSIHDKYRKVFASDADSLLDIELDSARQGEEGLEKVVAAMAEQRPYALAFVDMRMPPGWDGLTTIEQLWKADPGLQAVICTTYSDDSFSEIYRRLGRTDRLLILKKPFDDAEVFQLAAAFTEKRRLTQKAAMKMEELEGLVTERTQHLKEAQQESERLLTSISSLLIGIDEQGVVRRWNLTAEQILRMAADDAIGRPFTSLDIDWQDPISLFRLIDDGLATDHQRIEVSFCEPEGAGHVLELFVYPVQQGERIDGLLILGTDLTERRRLEHQLYQAQKLESVGQLAAGVAHEINTPMQYIGDNVQYLKASWERLSSLLECLSSLDDDKTNSSEHLDAVCEKLRSLNLKKVLKVVPDALEDAEEGVHHVSRIVRALKEFSHPGSSERSPVDLNHALETTIVVAKNEWKYVAEVEMDLDPALPLVFGLGGELNQVFLNLLVNAAHAISSVTENGAKGKGHIRISTRHDGDTCTVMIQDTGGGIPADIEKKVFDPFFTTKDVGKGTGQGLAIAHQVVVQKHDGRIWFEVEPEVGTTFFVQLPVEESNTTSGQPEADATAVGNVTSSACS